MEGKMIVKKALMNQIERMIKQKLGVNPDAHKIRRLEVEVRTMQGNIARMQNMIDSSLENKCSKCQCKVREKSG
tara:strand:- start:1205 stop:1426 length:222 start_codon:yes stop_codon:yes gene_type:complete